MPAVVLLSWPLIGLGIFGALGPARGLIWTLLVGFLYLPEDYGFDLPVVFYGKHTAIVLSLVLGVLFTRSRDPEPPEVVDPMFGRLVIGLFLLLFVAQAITIFDNRDTLSRFGVIQPGNGPRDLVSFTVNTLIALTPFLLARRWLADPGFHAEFLRALVIMALIYSLFILFERRMSPQLNRWIYGLAPDAWFQHVRGGGFRPMVFLTHGLVVGYLLMSATLAATALARSETGQKRILYGLAAVWLFLVLVLSRNMGALLLTIMFAPAFLVFSRRMIVMAAMAVGLIFMFYPAARQAQIVPTNAFLSAIEAISPPRAQSFAFRLENEDGLLARAFEKPLFGWGGWGRSRVIDERGQDVSVTDGIWIIRLGQFGWIGYICFFGLVTAPLIFLRRRLPDGVPMATLGLATMAAANLVYMIPNATLDAPAWIIVGALAGYVQYGRARDPAAEEPAATGSRRPMGYTRFPIDPGVPIYRRDFERDA